MATDSRFLPANISNDAEFRTWAQGIAAQLAGAGGLVKTGDTGQIDLATAVKPAAINTAAGYEIYRFNDALQATKPVFLKVEYGIGSSLDRPGLWLTVGTQSTGAGVFTGVTTTTRIQVRNNASRGAGGLLLSYCSGGDGRVVIVSNVDPTVNTFAMGFAVERIKDSGGNPLGDAVGVLFLSYGNQSSIVSNTGFALLVHGAAVTMKNGSDTVGFSHGQSAVGSDVCVAPVFIPFGQWRFMMPVVYNRNDFADVTPFSMTHLGAVRTFMPLGVAIPAIILVNEPSTGVTSFGVAIPWE